MIAIDSSSLQRMFEGEEAWDTLLVERALESRRAFLPPAVVSEVLTHRGIEPRNELIVRRTPLLKIKDGYWFRAGVLRRNLLVLGRHATLPDVLIAQSCIDHGIPLLTYDRDFRHFEYAGLQLLKEDS